MEICGIPNSSFVDRCRKKEHYFDNDYSPFLIEDDEQGILRIPDSRKLESVIRTDDLSFIDFLKVSPWVSYNRNVLSSIRTLGSVQVRLFITLGSRASLKVKA
jgi:hypothetical protein